jgi:hypothetical protein
VTDSSEFRIDRDQAHVARVYDYMLGGTDNFEIDRQAADGVAAVYAGGWTDLRASVTANRSFVGRSVRYLAEEAGIRQFLDIGSGIPTMGNVHEVAQDVAPESRVVYVDFDPIVLAYAHAVKGTPEGATDFLVADLRDPDSILQRAAKTLDLSRPVGVLVIGTLHTIRDDEDPWGIVARYMEAMPAGSYLAIAHLTADFNPEEMAEVSDRLNAAMREPFVLRPHAEIARFFQGLDLVEPGLVQVEEWHPDSPPDPDRRIVDIYGGVARLP